MNAIQDRGPRESRRLRAATAPTPPAASTSANTRRAYTTALGRLGTWLVETEVSLSDLALAANGETRLAGLRDAASLTVADLDLVEQTITVQRREWSEKCLKAAMDCFLEREQNRAVFALPPQC